ncbi:MAG TPA: hypothetical protein PLT53_12935 [Prolixibacteraceae bacterium]|jgi:hypothetical protein|nr:hypothetical protein [Prolixibacteraceae bacterium]HNZ69639.1 hypothetical protein [Prolixibacteraceae bacterium]HOC87237.1 hypothetical protein [Prolixibacteraceae bacterium]HOG96527.1 hypothetical protein [Prolixibacteraceae bacterium]HPY28972.1 hypothetical protein [Prolixibacteraceae bacterium]
MKNVNFYSFIALYGALFLVLLFKVFHVPVTIDEVPTVYHYSRFSVWKIMMYPDNIPNNHILNTLLTKGTILLFGKEQWVIRLPNLLSFLLFAWGVFRILKLTLRLDSPWFLAGALLFVNPYLLDFFGLCRGYGISLTMVTLSAGFLLAGFGEGRHKFIWMALVCAILASYANFTALVFWAAVTIIAGFRFLWEYRKNPKQLVKPLLLITLLSLAYLALIMVPLQKMHSTNEFQYWTSRGFYHETVISLIHNWYYNSPVLSMIPHCWMLLPVALALGAALCASFIRKAVGPGAPESDLACHPLCGVLAATLVLLPAAINLLQTTILGTPNLSGRTALFFYPLVALLFVIVLTLAYRWRHSLAHRSLALILTILLAANLSHRISLQSVREWEFDSNTLEVIDFLKEKCKGSPISLKTSWFFHSSFTFYQITGKAPWINLQPYDYNIDIATPAEYYYIFAEDAAKLNPRFEVVHKFTPDRWLMKKKTN